MRQVNERPVFLFRNEVATPSYQADSGMRSKFWTFVEACDEARSPRAVRDLLVSTFRDLGVRSFAIVTHAPLADLRSLGVVVHNWPGPAIDYLFAHRASRSQNVMFDAVEASEAPMHWPSQQTRREWKRHHRVWFDALRGMLGEGEGVSQALKSTIVNASLSVIAAEKPDTERVRVFMRIGNYAYQQILALQRPLLSEPEQLTAREHEFLYRATVIGERPSDVAAQLGVKISTVRTLRQKASIRLDAGSQEQAAWRMIETGQLFRTGRKSRTRSR